MSEEIPFLGGCLCGRVRYAVRGPAVQTSLCHCSDCRKASGAPFVAWTFFRSGALSWIEGQPRIFQFAERERSFCGDCGTPLVFYDPGITEWFEVNTCTFDEPQLHAPLDECWAQDRIGWIGAVGQLPSYQRDAPLPGAS